MKAHTENFKNNIKMFGRQLDNKITFSIGGFEYELGSRELNSVSPHYNGSILKSVMKQIDIDSNIFIPKNTIFNYKLGVKVGNEYEYIDFGNYIVYSIEIQEDTKSYKIVAYDKMLYAKKDYEQMSIQYPITIREYINAVCQHLGLVFKNVNDEFVNYDKIIEKELFIDENGNILEYNFMDVLDQLAQVTASTICINEKTDELEVRYLNETNDTIDEKFLKNINVKFGAKNGPINTIVLSRSAGGDKIALSNPENLPDEDKKSIEIIDNQFMNFNDRDEYIEGILNQLYGLEYYINDFSSVGVCYYNLCDKYNVKIGENIYNCIMLNDEINVTKGLEENIFSNELINSETDYKKTNKTDRTISRTTFIVDKQGRIIEGLVYDMHDENGIVNENFTRVTQDIDQINTNIQTAGGVNLLLNSVMFAHNDEGIDNWETSGIGTINISDSPASVLAGGISGHVFTLNDMIARQKVNVKIDDETIPEEQKVFYTFSTKIKKDINGTCYVRIYNNNEEYIINVEQGQNPYFADYEITSLLPKDNYYIIEFYGSAGSNATFTDNMFTIGTYKKQWTQASGEIMNTQVNLGINGVSIKSATNEGTETNITPFEFAGYTVINGSRVKVFTLNGDTTEVERIKSKKEINMPPLKIVPITTGNRKGWAFVPTGSDN